MSTMPGNKDVILFFAKYPQAGRVKTRLAEAIGNAAAANLYRAFVEEIYLRIIKAGFSVIVFFDPPEKMEAFAAWLGSQHLVAQKQDADLGQRMCAAFEQAFEMGFERAICLGSDSPDLPLAFVSCAFKALDRFDAIIGPCQDGGYYAIGFSKSSFLPAAFFGPEWGGPKVSLKSMEILSENRREVYLAESWRDVDTIDDLRSLNRRNLTENTLSDSLARLVSSLAKTLH